MALAEWMRQNKAPVVTKWFQVLLADYAGESGRFLEKYQEQFANPMGYAFFQGLEGLFEQLLEGLEPHRVRPCLDKIMRIRAVEDFSPSQAVDFVFRLKGVVREQLSGEIQANRVSTPEILAFETMIDNLALLAFDQYMLCREHLNEVRINEIKNRTARLLARAGGATF